MTSSTGEHLKIPDAKAIVRSDYRRVRRTTPLGFEQRLLVRARRFGIGRGDHVVIGFSGGPDSLALASASRWLASRSGSRPLLVHVDHRLRPSSAEEADQAVRLAVTIDLECRIKTVAAPPQELHPGVGVEEAARRERYRILFDVAREYDAIAVATGHNLEDRAESVLLHLLRGGGVHGAAAMAEISDARQWHAADDDISQELRRPLLWRPLLGESRAAILRYLSELGLEPIYDPSNDDRALRRNVLRHEVLPLLDEHFPGAAVALARYAELAGVEDAYLDAVAGGRLAECVHQGGVLDASCLAQLPLPLRRRAVRLWLETARAPILTMDRTDAILTLATRGEGGRAVEIGEGWTVCLRRGMLHAERMDRSMPQEGEDR